MIGFGIIIKQWLQLRAISQVVSAAFFIALCAVAIYSAIDVVNSNAIERQAYKDYMHECVPRLTEQRCNELYRWR